MSKTKDSGFKPRVTSHAETMQNPRLHNRHVFKGLQDPYGMDAVQQEVVNGVVLKRSAVTTFDPVANMRGYKASDFALENIIAAGALASLKDSRLHYGSTSEISDNLEGTIDNVIAAVNDAEMNVEPQKSEGE